jgi:hypothetical protein
MARALDSKLPHHTRQVTRTEEDGKVEIPASTCGRKEFKSPDDIVVKSDGMRT